MSKQVNGGFVGLTEVLMGDDQHKRIDEIQVGDMVMAMPENGIGEPAPKKVTNTFKYENKAVWCLRLSSGGAYSVADLAVTAEHPFCVHGTNPCLNGNIDYYDTPQWKQVDELRVGDVLKTIISKDMTVVCVKPFAKDYTDGIAWLQGGGYMQNWQSQTTGSVWDITKPSRITKMIHEFSVDEENDANLIETDTPLWTPLYDNQGATDLMVTGAQYAPCLTTVYHIEVEDYHTYFVGYTGTLVHDIKGEATP